MNPALTVVIPEIEVDLQTIENDAKLPEEKCFTDRAEAIDNLNFHIIDRIDGLVRGPAEQSRLYALRNRAIMIKSILEGVNTALFSQLRRNIRSAMYKDGSFTSLVRSYITDFDGEGRESEAYEHLDTFINGIFSADAIPYETKVIQPGMIFYQKTPARIIFQMIRQANFKTDDLFFDLGSGLGQVVMLVNVVTGVPGMGIEYETAYCDYARKTASALNLFNIDFINADARIADYSPGTVFFMYSPFKGKMLEDVLELLRRESLNKMIRLFTYGPCSLQVAGRDWFQCISGKIEDANQLCEFRTVLTSPG